MKPSISEVFKNLKNKRAAFIPYFVLGLPDLKKSIEIILSCSEYFDIVELGIPFSDPVADGPTIQEGTQIALKNGYSMNDYFKAAKQISEKTNKPVVFMLYFNQIFACQTKKFMKKAKESGVQGLIIPDALPESDNELNKYAKKFGIDQIFLMTPLTDKKRMESVIEKTSGFLYLTALSGITGERKNVASGLKDFAKMIKNKTEKPVCVGFGISQPAHVKNISAFAQGVIVGSAIVRKVIENSDVVSFVRELSGAITKKSL